MLAHVGVYHCFARSGGTLVNRLLGASAGIVVLSEVGPAASVRDPVDQAITWLRLADADEADALRALPFGALVAELAGRAADRGRQLVVRDFPTPNFLPGAFGETLATGTLEGSQALAATELEVSRVVVARRAAAVYSSILRSVPHLAALPVDDFAVAYHGFARAVADQPVIRYEDLTAAPESVLPLLCDALGVRFDPDAVGRFAEFRDCTGDLDLPTPSRGAALGRVESLAERTDDPAFQAAARHPLCCAADELFGYSPSGAADPMWTAVAAHEHVLAGTRKELLARLSAATARAESAEVSTAQVAMEVAAYIERANRLEADLRAAAAEAARLRRSWDRTTGELARVEEVAEDRRRQVALLLEEVDRLTGGDPAEASAASPT